MKISTQIWMPSFVWCLLPRQISVFWHGAIAFYCCFFKKLDQTQLHWPHPQVWFLLQHWQWIHSGQYCCKTAIDWCQKNHHVALDWIANFTKCKSEHDLQIKNASQKAFSSACWCRLWKFSPWINSRQSIWALVAQLQSGNLKTKFTWWQSNHFVVHLKPAH